MELTIIDVLLEELAEVQKDIQANVYRRERLLKHLHEVCKHPESEITDSGNCGVCGMQEVDQL